MKHYTKIVPFELAVKLKDGGFPQDTSEMGYDKDGNLTSYYWQDCAAPSYADVIDYLIEKGMCVSVYALNVSGNIKWISHLMDISNDCKYDSSFGYKDSFDDAARPAIEKALDWLKSRFKSLGPQSHWKPSKEQMKALEYGMDDIRFCNLGKERLPILQSLYNDLEKLM